MPDLQMDVAVANRFISSLSKSLQALCHGCMDFDSGIEIVGYININIDSGSKVDYVLNEKVLKSTTNSMTFVSNSFLAKKDVPKHTRDGACSPIPELRPLPQTPYYRGAYQGPRSSMHFAQSYSQRGSQKRAWAGMERDWRVSPKRHRGGRVGHPSYQSASTPHNTAHTQSPIPGAQTADAEFKMPMPSEGTSISEAGQSAINVKKEVTDSDNTQQSSRLGLDQTSTEQSGEETSQTSEINIKNDPDAESIQIPPETSTDQGNESLSANTGDADFKGTFLHPGNDSTNTESNGEADMGEGVVDPNEQTAEQGNQHSSHISEQGDGSNIAEFGATSDNFPENMPSCSADFGEAGGDESYSQSAYSDAGEGSSDAGQFEVIEIEDEDEDVQGLFGDSRYFPETHNESTSTLSPHCYGTQLYRHDGDYHSEDSKRQGKAINIMKQRRQHGMEYIGRKYNGNSFEKQLKPARKMLGRCSCRRYQCHCISDQQRKLIFAEIMSMENEEKRQYIRMQVDNVEPAERKSLAEFSRSKKSLRYHMVVAGVRMPVCREMFLATTGLRRWWVLNSLTPRAD